MKRILWSVVFIAVWGGAGTGFGRCAYAGPAFQRTPPRKISPELYDKVVQWRTAVAQHDPGELDAAGIEIGHWPAADVRAVIGQITGLARLLANPRSNAHIETLQVQSLLGLTRDEALHGNPNRILKRGALLHTDIALLASILGPSSAGGGKTKWLIDDGRVVGEDTDLHWECARLLLDAVYPRPSSDEMVRMWYLSTAAGMQSRRQWGNAVEHLKRARAIFPSDARILFYSGTMHEFYAGPHAQNAALAAPLVALLAVDSRKSELESALGFLKEAVTAAPGFAEARLRLGRVSGLLGDHFRAVSELQQAAAAITDPLLLYYAALFLGQEHEMLGHYDEAREQFERAATLYPTAQSPRLALSHLALRSGDSPKVLFAMERVLTMPDTDPDREDPWWYYNVAHVRNADALLVGMRRTFGGLPR